VFFRRRQPPPTGLLAADLETSGLDASQDAILSLGTVPVVDGTIRWGERCHELVADPRLVRPRDVEAIGAHQILPSETAGGWNLERLLDELHAQLPPGGALLVHGGAIERRFLAAAARAVGRRAPELPMVDTLLYLRALDQHRGHLADRLPAAARRVESVPTSLAAARAFFELPSYPAHHALFDALGTAELYLLLARRFPEIHPRQVT